MQGDGVNVNTTELIEAANGFLAASKQTQNHADIMDAELRPYALNVDQFQGPQADEFRRLYAEIADDLAVIKTEANSMSVLVEQAKTEFMANAVKAANQLPSTGGGTGGSGVLQGLTGNK